MVMVAVVEHGRGRYRPIQPTSMDSQIGSVAQAIARQQTRLLGLAQARIVDVTAIRPVNGYDCLTVRSLRRGHVWLPTDPGAREPLKVSTVWIIGTRAGRRRRC